MSEKHAQRPSMWSKPKRKNRQIQNQSRRRKILFLQCKVQKEIQTQ